MLLLGYWYANTHDRADSWHWVGVAISLSQTLGLHRDPGRSHISFAQRRLWRRIWWCCFHRDRYIALGMGRPSRIVLEDCDVPALAIDDLVSHSSTPGLSPAAVATIQRCDQLAPLFLDMLKLSHILGAVLASQYRPVQTQSSAEMLQQHDLQLQSWSLNLDPVCRVHPIDSASETWAEHVLRAFLHITYHVVVITRYRPLIFQDPSHPETIQASKTAWDKCLSSASTAFDTLRRMAEDDLVRYLPPEM